MPQLAPASPRRLGAIPSRTEAVPEPYWQRADSLLSKRFDASERTTAWHEATTLEPGVAAAARVEPTPAKIGPTEPAEIEIATSVITSAGVVAGEAYVAAAGG